MSDEQPNIVFFYWDNFGWGELGCYGGGVLRGAPETLGIKPEDVSSTYLIVDPTREPVTPGELSLPIYVSSDYGSGYIELAADGTVKQINYPS